MPVIIVIMTCYDISATMHLAVAGGDTPLLITALRVSPLTQRTPAAYGAFITRCFPVTACYSLARGRKQTDRPGYDSRGQ